MPMNTTNTSAVDFRRFPEPTSGLAYRDWVREWRVVYKQLSALIRVRNLQIRLDKSALTHGGMLLAKPSLLQAFNQAALRAPLELHPSIGLMRPAFVPAQARHWWGMEAAARDMLEARKIGKEWARAHPRPAVSGPSD